MKKKNNESGETIISVLVAIMTCSVVFMATMTMIANAIRNQVQVDQLAGLEKIVSEIQTQVSSDVNLCASDEGGFFSNIEPAKDAANEYSLALTLNSSGKSLAATSVVGADQNLIDGWNIVDVRIKEIASTGLNEYSSANLAVTFAREYGDGEQKRKVQKTRRLPLIVKFNAAGKISCWSNEGYFKKQRHENELAAIMQEIRNQIGRADLGQNFCDPLKSKQSFIEGENYSSSHSGVPIVLSLNRKTTQNQVLKIRDPSLNSYADANPVIGWSNTSDGEQADSVWAIDELKIGDLSKFIYNSESDGPYYREANLIIKASRKTATANVARPVTQKIPIIASFEKKSQSSPGKMTGCFAVVPELAKNMCQSLGKNYDSTKGVCETSECRPPAPRVEFVGADPADTRYVVAGSASLQTFTVEVTNQGTENCGGNVIYNLSVGSSTAALSPLSVSPQKSMSIVPGGKLTATVKVSVPSTLAANETPYTFIVKAENSINPASQASATGAILVSRGATTGYCSGYGTLKVVGPNNDKCRTWGPDCLNKRNNKNDIECKTDGRGSAVCAAEKIDGEYNTYNVHKEAAKGIAYCAAGTKFEWVEAPALPEWAPAKVDPDMMNRAGTVWYTYFMVRYSTPGTLWTFCCR